ncbi:MULTISPECIES: hypothetical protein [Parabacteroides]|uniref:O-antigen ligase domain-containing protein n=5 Tax=Parabacteroides goldsteinii TaxID=328812 RepID=A0A6G1ZHS2_9BACT|nr:MULTISPECIES: hypothetical protein [Parabacteroides]EOS14424.1 hypothetical protein C803_04565 [Parabacteroides goldsteinii dnLKV18]KAI4362312.1 hypothetical protein C825_004395 [Parabacteroides sp. ASF519]MBF0767005.1 hypothetical protein [Parabacteroides goldsteinii]MRX91621.1 hypothetical protein [Parabacteroides goldsteinii]MRX99068.1 hypothetical protein [Parabacteroides goldsteinii]
MQKLIPLFCVNWIIFFFQFESFGIGPVTVVRFLIFPFLLLYVFSVRRMNIYKSFSLLFCLFFCVFEVVSGVFNAEIHFCIQGIINFLTIVVFVDFLTKNKGLSYTNLLLFASYDLSSILFYLITFSGVNLANRFQGIYWDPNVMCVYIFISFCAKMVLFSQEKRNMLKLILGLFFLLDIIVIFSSLSRAGILGLGVTVLLVFFMYSKWLFSFLVGILSVVLGYMYHIAFSLTWSLSLTPLEALTYRLFVSSTVELEEGGVGSRSDRLERLFESLEKGEVSLFGNGTNYLPDGEFMHNGIAEFILAAGIILGTTFIGVFIYLICVNIIWPILKGKRNLFLLFVLSFFIVTVFYSYLSFKSFWVFISFLLFLNIERVKVNNVNFVNM